jgi:monofunctional biosynthetic peptidoglycan transglycosylase
LEADIRIRAKSIGRALLALVAVGFGVLAYVYLTLPDVRVLRTTNPDTTAFMELRQREAAREGKNLRHAHRWVPYSRISQSLKRAVLAAEDDAFWDHEGVDYEQLRAAVETTLERGAPLRGASTITQQLAKNLYLSDSRDYLRKLRELIIARRLEAELPKARILEIYLNVIEWGDGIWGAEAAARTYFGVPASSVNADQAALLAAAIINPRLLNPGKPSARLLRRQRLIRGRMRGVDPPTAASIPAPSPVPAAAGDAGSAPPEVVTEGVPELLPNEPIPAEPPPPEPSAAPVPEPFPMPAPAP